MAHHGAGIVEEDIQGLSGSNRINLMVLIVSMPVGGVENQILSVVRRLDRQRYNVTICCIKDRGELGQKAEETGIRVRALNLMKSNRFSLNIPLQILKIMRENDINILWTHQYVANLYGRMAALLAGKTGTIATFRARYDNPKLHRRLFNHILSYRTDVMVAVSHAVASDVVSYDRVDPQKMQVIYNGIDLSQFDTALSKEECRKRLGLPDEGLIIGTTGRLSKEKNHKVIIEALSMLPGNIKGLIVGDGPLRAMLEKAGVGRIYFLGQLSYQSVPLALKAMDIFCFPSLWEGMPSALVEAMATGLPVIASDIPSNREVLNEAGIYVSPGDAGTLAKNIAALNELADLKDELGNKARERAKLFSIEQTVMNYNRLFEKIVKKEGGS